MKQKFIISYEWWEMTVEIDYDKAKESIKEMVEFWMDWKRRLDLNDGDYITTFLQQLARTVIVLSMEYNLKGVISAFEEREGWSKMDGSEGITILDVSSWTFEDNEFTIKSAT